MFPMVRVPSWPKLKYCGSRVPQQKRPKNGVRFWTGVFFGMDLGTDWNVLPVTILKNSANKNTQNNGWFFDGPNLVLGVLFFAGHPLSLIQMPAWTEQNRGARTRAQGAPGTASFHFPLRRTRIKSSTREYSYDGRMSGQSVECEGIVGRDTLTTHQSPVGILCTFL